MRAPDLAAALATVLVAAGCDATIGDASPADAGDNDAPAAVDAGIADAAPDAALPDAAPCVEGDDNTVDPNSGHCYMIFSSPATWQQAVTACEDLGGHLTVSTSAEENDVFSPLAGAEDIWVGGNDIDTEGQWVWVTGEPMDYTNWRSGEPNDYGSGEDCMIIEGENGGLWDDRPCDLTYGYLCERP